MGMLTTVRDRPGVVTVTVVGAVAVHAVASYRWEAVPDLFELASQEAGFLYLGFSAIAATLAGFSAVILVLVSSAGVRLQEAWLAPVTSAFGAAFVAALAAVGSVMDHDRTGTWLFEMSALLAAHAALRLTWLLHCLVVDARAAKADDQHVGAGVRP